MLDMGFLPDLKRIIKALPQRRQSLFFSATMPPKIVELTERLLTDPISVNVTPKSQSVKKIEQRVVFVDRKGKQELLATILSGSDVERAIVFTRTKRNANIVAERLNRKGIKSAAIHGNKSQNARQRALDAFRNQFVSVLVATDVAARGIDIDGITHVINYDLPTEPEAYVHRIGRTGRAGAHGIALSFCTDDDRGDLQAIERLIRQSISVDKQLSQRSLSRDAGGNRAARPHGSASPSRSRARNSTKRNPSKQNQRRRTRKTSSSAAPNPKPRAANASGGEASTESSSPKRRRRPRRGKNERQRAKTAGAG